MGQGRVLGADGAREYLVLPEAVNRDVCAGFDLKAATRRLVGRRAGRHGQVCCGGKRARTRRGSAA